MAKGRDQKSEIKGQKTAKRDCSGGLVHLMTGQMKETHCGCQDPAAMRTERSCNVTCVPCLRERVRADAARFAEVCLQVESLETGLKTVGESLSAERRRSEELVKQVERAVQHGFDAQHEAEVLKERCALLQETCERAAESAQKNQDEINSWRRDALTWQRAAACAAAAVFAVSSHED